MDLGEAPKLMEVIFHHLPHVMSFVMNYNFKTVFDKCPRDFQATKWNLVTYKEKKGIPDHVQVSRHFDLQIPVNDSNTAVSIETYIEGVITGVYAFPIWKKNSIVIPSSVPETPTPKKKPKRTKITDIESEEEVDEVDPLHQLIEPLNELTETVMYNESNSKVIRALTMKIRRMFRDIVSETGRNHMMAFDEKLEEKYAIEQKQSDESRHTYDRESESEYESPVRTQYIPLGQKRATRSIEKKQKESEKVEPPAKKQKESEKVELPAKKRSRTTRRNDEKIGSEEAESPTRKKSASPTKKGKKKT
jgi:hypothetical protein